MEFANLLAGACELVSKGSKNRQGRPGIIHTSLRKKETEELRARCLHRFPANSVSREHTNDGVVREAIARKAEPGESP